MALLTNEEQLDRTLERYYNRYNKYNEKVLKTLGKTIKEIGEMKPSEVHQLAQQLKYSDNIEKLTQELADITDKSTEDINKLFDKFAEENVEFAEIYYEMKNKEYITYEDNIQLQRMIQAIATNTSDKMINLSNTRAIGFVYKDEFGNVSFKGLQKTYYDLIDEAVYKVATGTKDYQSAMRSVMNSLADSGIRTHEEKIGYESGYSKRLDSAIRQNVLDGLRDVNQNIENQIGNEIGANGIEISAHFPCAEDHLDIQGRRFVAKEGETTEDLIDRINSNLDRPIGEYNCKHFIMPIIVGVDDPMYSEHRLWKWKQQSYEKIEYEGKRYTPYEATQMQRKLETAIRKQKDRQIIARSSGDKEGIRIAQQKISELTTKYNEFSNAMNMDTYKNRLTVSGYHRVKAS